MVTGTQHLTIGATAGIELSGNARTLGFSGAVNLNASAFTGVLRVAGSRSDDAIAGGSGDDIIYGLDGADTLTGNGGADQFRMVGSSGKDLIIYIHGYNNDFRGASALNRNTPSLSFTRTVSPLRAFALNAANSRRNVRTLVTMISSV